MKSFSELVRLLNEKWGHTYVWREELQEEPPYGEAPAPLSYKAEEEKD